MKPSTKPTENTAELGNKSKPLLAVRLWILSIPYFWYIETEWDWSDEWDYVRKPRQFLRNKIYKDYMITSIFRNKPFTIKEAVRFFVIDYKNNELFEDRLSVVQNNV